MVDSELSKCTNAAASAAMVSDVILSTSVPTLEVLNNMTHHDLSAEFGSERFGQMLIKSWVAELIKEFKREIFREASYYFGAMEGVIEEGDAYFTGEYRVCVFV